MVLCVKEKKNRTIHYRYREQNMRKENKTNNTQHPRSKRNGDREYFFLTSIIVPKMKKEKINFIGRFFLSNEKSSPTKDKCNDSLHYFLWKQTRYKGAKGKTIDDPNEIGRKIFVKTKGEKNQSSWMCFCIIYIYDYLSLGWKINWA